MEPLVAWDAPYIELSRSGRIEVVDPLTSRISSSDNVDSSEELGRTGPRDQTHTHKTDPRRLVDVWPCRSRPHPRTAALCDGDTARSTQFDGDGRAQDAAGGGSAGSECSGLGVPRVCGWRGWCGTEAMARRGGGRGRRTRRGGWSNEGGWRGDRRWVEAGRERGDGMAVAARVTRFFGSAEGADAWSSGDHVQGCCPGRLWS